MQQFLIFGILISFSVVRASNSLLEDATADTELLLSFVIHRHGDRTPVSEMAFLSENGNKFSELSYPFGPGDLTNEGKMRSYNIGKYLRQRYNELLSEMYYSNEIYVRSTDTERSKMTILTALSALYAPLPAQRWKDDLPWQPIPYYMVPSEKDYLSFFSKTCGPNANWRSGLNNITITDQYNNLLNLLDDHIPGINFKFNQMYVFYYHDMIVSEQAIGLPVSEWLEPYMDKLREMATIAMYQFYSTDELKRYSGGVFLNEFFSAANSIIAGEDIKQRVRVYSTHDINVAAELAATRVQFVIPKYGAVYSLELRRNREGQYIVLPVYLPQAGASEPIALTVEGCNEYCKYNEFQQLTASYTLTEQQFFENCQE